MSRRSIGRCKAHKYQFLSNEQVEQIRQMDAPHRDIARTFGCSESYVSAIKAGRVRKGTRGNRVPQGAYEGM